jgi:hypothetical protein
MSGPKQTGLKAQTVQQRMTEVFHPSSMVLVNWGKGLKEIMHALSNERRITGGTGESFAVVVWMMNECFDGNQNYVAGIQQDPGFKKTLDDLEQELDFWGTRIVVCGASHKTWQCNPAFDDDRDYAM